MRGLQWIICPLCQRMLLCYVYHNYPVANCVFFPFGAEQEAYSGFIRACLLTAAALLSNCLLVLPLVISCVTFPQIHNLI